MTQLVQITEFILFRTKLRRIAARQKTQNGQELQIRDLALKGSKQP